MGCGCKERKRRMVAALKRKKLKRLAKAVEALPTPDFDPTRPIGRILRREPDEES